MTSAGAPPDAVDALERLLHALTVATIANDGGFEQLRSLLHQDVAVTSVPGVAPGTGYYGHEAFLRYFAEAKASRVHTRAAITEASVTPSGNVFASGELIVETQGHVDTIPAWIVYRFQDRLVSAIETYLDRDMAWDAAQTTSADPGPPVRW